MSKWRQLPADQLRAEVIPPSPRWQLLPLVIGGGWGDSTPPSPAKRMHHLAGARMQRRAAVQRRRIGDGLHIALAGGPAEVGAEPAIIGQRHAAVVALGDEFAGLGEGMKVAHGERRRALVDTGIVVAVDNRIAAFGNGDGP